MDRIPWGAAGPPEGSGLCLGVCGLCAGGAGPALRGTGAQTEEAPHGDSAPAGADVETRGGCCGATGVTWVSAGRRPLLRGSVHFHVYVRSLHRTGRGPRGKHGLPRDFCAARVLGGLPVGPTSRSPPSGTPARGVERVRPWEAVLATGLFSAVERALSLGMTPALTLGASLCLSRRWCPPPRLVGLLEAHTQKAYISVWKGDFHFL